MEKVGERRFVLKQHSCMIYLSSKIYRKVITFFASQKFAVEKYDYDNNQKLQTVSPLQKRCATGTNFLGKSNCSSVFETS